MAVNNLHHVPDNSMLFADVPLRNCSL